MDEKDFIFAAEYAYYENDGDKRRIMVVEFPASKETLQTLTDKIGEEGYVRDGPFPHYAEGSIRGLDEVLNDMDEDISPDDLNDLADAIGKMDEFSRVTLRDVIDWWRDNETEYLGYMLDALSEVTRRGVQLSEAREEIVKLKAPRMVEGYEVIQSVKIDGQEIIVGENTNAEYGKQYMLWNRSLNADFGQESHLLPVYDADYLAVMRKFTEYASRGVDSLNLDRTYRGNRFIDPMLTEKFCVPGGMNESCDGKVIAIKPELYLPEYRSETYQLQLATGGNGCSPTAIGRTVFCANLYSGERHAYDREDVLGVIDEKTLPKWAKEQLVKLRDPGCRGEQRRAVCAATSPNERPSTLAAIEEGKARQKGWREERQELGASHKKQTNKGESEL